MKSSLRGVGCAWSVGGLRTIAALTLWGAFALAPAGRAQTRPSFSGTWKQSDQRCEPKRTGDVTLRIDEQDPHLVVETTMLRGSAPPRHALQQYTTDGQVSVSTGADGDEFHTAVTRSGSALVFAIEEHEEGRVLRSQEVWTVQENGHVLQRVRHRTGDDQTLIYVR